jgi:hypothetical protein
MGTLPLYSRPRRKRIGPEAQLQLAVMQHLAFAKAEGVVYFHPANEGRRSEAEGAHLKRLGMLPGTADLILVGVGLPHSALELKARGGKPSPEQNAFAAAWRASGGRYAWADNIDSALKILIDWGFLDYQRRRRVA